MVNIILSGCNGTMGKNIIQAAEETRGVTIICGIDVKEDRQARFPVVASPRDFTANADVIVDFSHPSVTDDLLSFAVERKIPIVIATTGLSSKQKENIKAAAETIPVFFSANMSLGINLLIDLVKKAAAFLADDHDIEIVERHHNKKIDAPSGTALYIADEIAKVLPFEPSYTYDRHSRRAKREKTEIGIHAIRGGTIPGDHEVLFIGDSEILEIKHSAVSKRVFAEGALRAAVFLQGKAPGLYNMNDIVGGDS